MDIGDVLHMIIKDETGTAITIELVNADDPSTAEDTDP